MTNQTSPKITGVHLVGSIPLSSNEEVFRSVFPALPGRVKRVPDGETGDRNYFTMWQLKNPVFKTQPLLLHEFFDPDGPTTFSDKEADDLVKEVEGYESGYDKAAIESYQVFKRLRDEGVIPKDVRFLVCLPTPVVLVGQKYRKALMTRIEPIIEAHMIEVVRRLQENIPSEDLAIQWDAPIEFALLAGNPTIIKPGHEMVAWFEPIFEGIIDRLVRIGEAVGEGVDLGYHFCYGDVNRTHFVRPKDAGPMADVGEALLSNIQRPVDFIHLPVLKEWTDKEHIEPLRKMVAKADGKTEFFLGLVHEHDEKGTQERIDAASDVFDSFGVATECGMGRRDKPLLLNSWEISTAVSEPYVHWEETQSKM